MNFGTNSLNTKKDKFFKSQFFISLFNSLKEVLDEGVVKYLIHSYNYDFNTSQYIYYKLEMINKNKIFGMRLADPQIFQLDFYGVKKYEGINEEDNMPIYLKRVPLQLNNSCLCEDIIPGRIKLQVEAYNVLQHPYFVQTTRMFQQNYHMHLVSERGITNLSNSMDKIYSQQKIFQIVLDLVVGLCFMRSNGYLHCNFVTSNIEICETNIKIGGIEACFREDRAHQIYRLCKVFDYRKMCPEFLTNEYFSEKGLIWNFGLIFYELVFKKLPFEGKTKQQIRKKILAGVRLQSSSCHPLFCILIAGCLRPNPTCRFSLNQILRCILQCKELSYQLEQILWKKIGALKQAYTLPQSEFMFNKYTAMIQILCQLDFIRFLERFIFLVSKIETKIDAPPIRSLTQYIIKCRLHQLKKHQYWGRENCCKKIEFDLLEILANHNSVKFQQEQLNSQDYCFFRLQEYDYRQIVYMQFQAFLRQFISKHASYMYRKGVSSIQTEKYTIYSVDFALSLFAINADLIQGGLQHIWSIQDADQIRKLSQNGLQPNTNKLFRGVIERVFEFDLLV